MFHTRIMAKVKSKDIFDGKIIVEFVIPPSVGMDDTPTGNITEPTSCNFGTMKLYVDNKELEEKIDRRHSLSMVIMDSVEFDAYQEFTKQRELQTA